MVKVTNITVKGQVTIPKDVRDALGLEPGALVEIDWAGGDVATTRRAVKDRDAEIARTDARIRETSRRFAHLREGRSSEEIMRDIRGDDPFPP